MNQAKSVRLKSSSGKLNWVPSSNFVFSLYQSGLVLLLSLALLAGLSLLALLAASSMLQQQHMAANHSDGELARLAAMTAVSAGEKFLLSLPNDSRIEGCRSECFVEPAQSWIMRAGTAPGQPEFLADDWWLQWGRSVNAEYDESPGSGNSALAWSLPGRHPPLFIIQELEFIAASESQDDTGLPMIAGVAYYQVLGRGAGLGRNNTHVAESILARPWLATSPEGSGGFSDCREFRPAYDCGRMAYRERR